MKLKDSCKIIMHIVSGHFVKKFLKRIRVPEMKEAVNGGVLLKKVLLKISQKSQKNTFTRAQAPATVKRSKALARHRSKRKKEKYLCQSTCLSNRAPS